MHLRITRCAVLIFLVFITVQLTQAQEAIPAADKKAAFAVTAGYAEKLDQFSGPSRGFHLGLNMYKSNARRLGWDTQLAFNLTDDKNSSSTYFTPTIMGGGRYYFTSDEKRIRVFTNFLAGFALELESGDDFTATEPDIGYSVGLFVQAKKWVYGVSVESPENLIFKVGITF